MGRGSICHNQVESRKVSYLSNFATLDNAGGQGNVVGSAVDAGHEVRLVDFDTPLGESIRGLVRLDAVWTRHGRANLAEIQR